MVIGKVPTPLVVKDATTRFSQSDWNEVSGLRGPAVNDWPGFGFWFNYFWDEAITVPDLSTADKQMLVETFQGVFQKGPGGWQLRTDTEATEDYHRLKMLRNLLHIGFVRVPYEPGGAQGYRMNPATDAASLFTEVVNFASSGGSPAPMKIGWRSDARPYKDLCVEGFQARARQDGVNAEWSLNKPWHPYSLDVYRSAIYLRKGMNRDNCLHTAVSIGTDFKQLVHFPIFTDYSLYQPPAGPIDPTWISPVVVNAKGHTARVGSDPLGKFLEHDTQVYAVRISVAMKGYHTEHFQEIAGKDPFPERSLNAVPPHNILALVVITRKYWWDDSSRAKSEHHWQLFDVECKELQILNPTLLKLLAGDAAASTLESHIRVRVAEAKNRGDIAADRAKRQRELTPKPVASAAAKKSAVCDVCGQTFTSNLMLTQHKNLQH